MITSTQQTTAKLVGFLYVLQMALAIFGEIFVRGRLIVPRDAVQTAANIKASETLFRFSLASDLFIYAGVIVLSWGIYVILRPIHRDAALLGVFLRLVENAVLAVTTLTGFFALRLLSSAAYLQGLETTQLQTLARVFLSMYGTGLGIGFVFLGLGSAVFSYVWWKSRYIPRLIAGWGIFASLLLALMSLLTMVFPRIYETIGMAFMMPMGLYEVGLGFWLMFKGLREPTARSAAI